MQQEQNFTQGPILSALLKFALPVLLALLLQAMYGAVDLQAVGKFGAAADISAVSTGSQILHTTTIVITSLAMGVTVLLGQRIGEGRADAAGKVVGGAVCLFAVVAVLMTAFLLGLAPQLAALLHAPENAFGGTVTYIRICGGGALFIVAYNLLGSVFRGVGDSLMPLLTVAIACGLNIIGDLLLVAVFDMGVAGVAIATVFAQGVSVLISLFLLRHRQLPFLMTRRDVRFDRGVTLNVLRLGIPVSLQELLVGISFMVILAIANDMGVVPSAGVGVAEKLCAFVMLVPSAYMQSMSAFVAQNIGAGREDRARRALWCGIGSSLMVGAVIGGLSFFRGDLLTMIFADDPAVIQAAWEYLKAYAIDCLLTSFLFCFIGYFNGRGQTMFVMIQGVVGAVGIRVTMAMLMKTLVPGSLFHLGLSTPASSMVQILLCIAYFLWQKRQSSNFRETSCMS